MKTLVIALLILAGVNSYGQEFVFKLYFQDSKGNKDTIALGYDKSATDTIDLKQGEFNIIDKPLDKVFDVRISDIWHGNPIDQSNVSFQTKRQIVNDHGDGWWFPAVTIDLFCTNWPVTVKWDSTLFNNAYNIGSILTSWTPGGWFDVGGGFVIELSRTSGMKIQKFIANDYSTYDNGTRYFYVNNNNDTIYVFWQAFGDSRLPHLAVDDFYIQNNYTFYPIPANGITFLKGDITMVQDIVVFDSTGNQILYTKSDKIDLTKVNDGVYIARIKLISGRIINRKLIIVR